MKICKVKFMKVDFDKYFNGENNYYTITEKYFANETDAINFIDNDMVEYVPTFGTTKIVKEAGAGHIEIIEIE